MQIGGHQDLVTLARLDACLGRRRALERARKTEPWAETVDAVLLQIPNTAPTADPEIEQSLERVTADLAGP